MDSADADGVIDAQLHEIGPRSRLDVADVAMRHHIMTELTLGSMDAVGVSAALLHPHDESWAAAAIEEFPDRFGLVLVLDPGTPDIAERVADVRRKRNFVGVRAVIGGPTKRNIMKLESGVWDPLLSECERTTTPVFLFVSGYLPAVERIARKFQQLVLIVDHLGLRQPPMDIRDDPPFRTVRRLLDLATFPNVFVKLCGLPALSVEKFPFADVWPHFDLVLNRFGTERLMWASDISRFQGLIGWRDHFPAAHDPYPGKHTYAESLNLLKLSDSLTKSEKSQILGGTARRVLGWPRAGWS